MIAANRSPLRSDYKALIEAARQGSREALGKVFEACQDYLLHIANQELDSELRPKVGASDVVQETLMRAERNFEGFVGDRLEDVRAWLRIILKRELANNRRRYGADKRNLNLEQSREGSPTFSPCAIADPAPSPSRQAIAWEDREGLERALRCLPRHYEHVLRLRYFEGLSLVEIGAQMGKSADAVRKTWMRALQELQVILKSRGSGSGSTP